MNRRNTRPIRQIPTSAELSRILVLACGVAAIAAIVVAPFSSKAAQKSPAPTDAGALPDGPGKAIVIKACLSCHDAQKITSFRGSEDDWADEVNKMIGRGAILSDDDVDQVVDYLAAHFGPAGSGSASSAPSGDSGGAPAPEKTPASPASGASATTVNVNKAGADALQSALGLSRQEADAIVQFREQHGSFKSLQELESVPGVPPEKIKENQKLIVF
jgi:competence ComEA-like helix-hairpin-helix protein